MNYIFASENHISAITDSIYADAHKHWMLQLFISTNGNFTIEVEGQQISCCYILVAANTMHSFCSENKLHFTMLVEHTSLLAKQLIEKYLYNCKYYVFDNMSSQLIQKELQETEHIFSNNGYVYFFNKLLNALCIDRTIGKRYDDRIVEILRVLNHCDCNEHTLEQLASKVCLSKSRMSHLFKKETGMPLKSYLVLYKIQKAYLYLFENGNVTDAAMKAGFDSPSHFAYSSKIMTGMSAKSINKDSVFLKVSESDMF